MRDCTEHAYAKLNLSLDVTARREDGYHDLAMLMQTVSLCDELRLRFRDDGQVRANSNLRDEYIGIQAELQQGCMYEWSYDLEEISSNAVTINHLSFKRVGTSAE